MGLKWSHCEWCWNNWKRGQGPGQSLKHSMIANNQHTEQTNLSSTIWMDSVTTEVISNNPVCTFFLESHGLFLGYPQNGSCYCEMSGRVLPAAFSLGVSKDDRRLNPCLCHSPSSWHKWILHADPETFVKATFFNLNSELSAMAAALQAAETWRGPLCSAPPVVPSVPPQTPGFCLKCSLLELIYFCFILRKQHEITSKMGDLIWKTTERTLLFGSFPRTH